MRTRCSFGVNIMLTWLRKFVSVHFGTADLKVMMEKSSKFGEFVVLCADYHKLPPNQVAKAQIVESDKFVDAEAGFNYSWPALLVIYTLREIDETHSLAYI